MLLAACVAALVVGTASAAITNYSGLDAGVGPGGAHPNSTAAAASFNTAASALGTVMTEDFESAAVGTFTNLALPQMTVTTSNVEGGISNAPGNAILGYNTTSGGSKYLALLPPFANVTSSVTMTFDQPISAWGAMFTGTGAVPNTAVSVVFDDGTTQSYSPPAASSGGIGFFGFTDPGKAIASVTVQEVLTSTDLRDVFAIDDVKFVYYLPTTLDECKKDAWKNWPVFKNQGDCVSFVASGGENPPANG
jgi:hypothetical protein